MSTRGMGIGAAVGVADEGTPGTPEDPTIYLPFVSESLKAGRSLVESGTITGDRSVRSRQSGLRSGTGDLVVDLDGVGFGWLFNKFNGNASGALTTSSLGGFLTTFSGSAAAGGNLPAGVYRYVLETVWVGPNGAMVSLPKTGEVSVIAASSNLTAALAWSAPAAPPAPWALGGTAIFRTAVGGASGSQRFLDFVTGAGTSYNDTGSGSLGTAKPWSAGSTIKRHVFTRAFDIGSHPLDPFTTTILKDNDYADQFALCRMNSAELSFKDGNTISQGKFGIMARDHRRVANPTPSSTNVDKFMGWQTQVAIQGTYQEIVESMTISATNGCALRGGFSGKPRYRDVGYGRRMVNGTLGRAFETHEFYDYMWAGLPFELRTLAEGACLALPATGDTYTFQVDGEDVEPLKYWMCIDLYGCKVGEAGANANGDGPMTEQIQFGTQVDESQGTEMRVALVNMTGGY